MSSGANYVEVVSRCPLHNLQLACTGLRYSRMHPIIPIPIRRCVCIVLQCLQLEASRFQESDLPGVGSFGYFEACNSRIGSFSCRSLCRDSSTNSKLSIFYMKLNAIMTFNGFICDELKPILPFFSINWAQVDLQLVQIRQIWMWKLYGVGIPADSGIPTPMAGRSPPGVGVAFLRNRPASITLFAIANVLTFCQERNFTQTHVQPPPSDCQGAI